MPCTSTNRLLFRLLFGPRLLSKLHSYAPLFNKVEDVSSIKLSRGYRSRTKLSKGKLVSLK